MSALVQRQSRRVAVVAAGTLWLTAVVGSAQSPPLAEVARKEQERRKTTPPATRVLTNKDLPRITSPAVAPPAGEKGATAASPGAADPAKTDKDKIEKDEAWWRARIGTARDNLRRDEVLLDALQARVNGLTSEFVGRDDPHQRARLGEDRRKAIVELDRVRLEVDGLRKMIEEIEEDARKASVPPGWLR